MSSIGYIHAMRRTTKSAMKPFNKGIQQALRLARTTLKSANNTTLILGHLINKILKTGNNEDVMM